MLMSRKRGLVVFLLVLAFLVVLLVPFNALMAPQRALRIVTSDGGPIGDATVTQIWYQYTLDIEGRADLQANLHGEVTLPRREVRTNILILVLGGLRNTVLYTINASYGPSESLRIRAPGYESKWFHSDVINGKELASGTVVLYPTTSEKAKGGIL